MRSTSQTALDCRANSHAEPGRTAALIIAQSGSRRETTNIRIRTTSSRRNLSSHVSISLVQDSPSLVSRDSVIRWNLSQCTLYR